MPFERGFCGTCLQHTEVALAATIFTSTFGSWDTIRVDPATGNRHICLPCGWAWRAKELQYHPTIISRDGATFCHPNGAQLRAALNGPIAADIAILLPITGKRAVAPHARWGTLTTDTGPFKWERRHARLVQALLTLKKRGLTEPTLKEDDLPQYVFDKVPADLWEDTYAQWRRIAPVRQDKPLFSALLKLSRENM